MQSHLNRKEISSNDLHKLDRMARKVCLSYMVTLLMCYDGFKFEPHPMEMKK